MLPSIRERALCSHPRYSLPRDRWKRHPTARTVDVSTNIPLGNHLKKALNVARALVHSGTASGERRWLGCSCRKPIDAKVRGCRLNRPSANDRMLEFVTKEKL
jgi:hypothetical protein